METKEPLEIITIQEYDPNRDRHFGEKNKHPPKYEVIHLTQYPNGDQSGTAILYDYTETQILHSLALTLELSREHEAKLDFRLGNDHLHIKETSDIMLRNHNYFVNELEKQKNALIGLLKK